MRSIFHVEANTPEDFRAELIRWLEQEEFKCRAAREIARLVRDRHHAESQRTAYQLALNFWREIIIDPKPSVPVPIPASELELLEQFDDLL